MTIAPITSKKAVKYQILIFILLFAISVGGFAGMIATIDLSELSTFRVEASLV